MVVRLSHGLSFVTFELPFKLERADNRGLHCVCELNKLQFDLIYALMAVNITFHIPL